MKRVGIYLRLSTDDQTTENQQLELEAVAGRSGWEIVGFYVDAGISGAKGRDQRPGMMRAIPIASLRSLLLICILSTALAWRASMQIPEAKSLELGP